MALSSSKAAWLVWGRREPLFYGLHAVFIEGSNGIADRLVIATQELGCCRSRFASCAGQQYLAAAHRESVW
jgi:hypothetical protein